jgi:hypothetical protein
MMKKTELFYQVESSAIVDGPTGWPGNIGKKSDPTEFGYYPLWIDEPDKPGPYQTSTASDPVVDEDSKRMVIFHTWVDAAPQDKREQILQIAEDQVPDYSRRELLLHPAKKVEQDKGIQQRQALKKALDANSNSFNINIEKQLWRILNYVSVAKPNKF